jgi:two-component system, NtrC family, response regulator AtoC
MVKILVVDNEPDLTTQLGWTVRREGWETLSSDSAEQAIRLIHENDFDVVVTDLRMETQEAGLLVLKAAKEKDIYTQVILVTFYGTPEVSAEVMRLGAFDYLERNAPGTDHLTMLLRKVELALEFRAMKLNR